MIATIVIIVMNINFIGRVNTKDSQWIGGSWGVEKERETCSFHPATIACHNASMARSHDQKTCVCYLNIDFV